MAEFDPRQLDLLEDALEDLDQIDDLASLELSPALHERLAEYRDVLALCRDAFPIETPADELLAEVIAEAHEVSRRPKLREGLEARGGWHSFWERWRGTVIPTLALAGTAAAVLLLLEPDVMHDDVASRSTDTSETQGRADKTEDLERSQAASERTFESTAKKDAGDNSGDNSGDKSDDAPGLGGAPEPSAEAISDAATPSDPEPSRPTAPRKSSPTPKHAKSAGESAPEPAPAPMSKDDTWTSLERANAARRTGNCDRARTIYEEVIAAGADALAVARAKAGIGLCYEQDRHVSQAATWFDDARAANPGIDAWINTQRDEQPMPGEKKKSQKAEAFDADSL